MKVTFEVEFNIYGELPSKEILEAGLWKLSAEAGYIGSEEVDGTDDWGIEVVSTEMKLEYESEGIAND